MEAPAITAAEIAMVRSVARRLAGRLRGLVEYDDLVGDGLEILVLEAPKWNRRPGHGARDDFHGFIGQRVRWGLIDRIRVAHGRDLQRRRPLSLDATMDGTPFSDCLVDERADTSVTVDATLALDMIRALPNARWREVMLRCAAGETQEEIGRRLGVSASRVSQIERSARYEMLHGLRGRRR